MTRFLIALAFVATLFGSTAILTAEEPTQTAPDSESSKPELPKFPIFKNGDKIYLSVKGNVPRMMVYLPSVEKDEHKHPDKYDYSKGEFLIPYDDKVDVRIWTRSGTDREVMRINAKKLLDNLQKHIKENPTDKKKWQYKQSVDEYSVNFQFVGIQRIFRLHSITVPKSSDLQKREEYKGGTPPKLHLFVDINGVLKKNIPTSRKGRSMTFPQDVSSQFELREWTDETIELRLKDRNTWTTRRQLMEFPNLSITDIQGGTVREKLSDLEDSKTAVELKFRPVAP